MSRKELRQISMFLLITLIAIIIIMTSAVMFYGNRPPEPEIQTSSLSIIVTIPTYPDSDSVESVLDSPQVISQEETIKYLALPKDSSGEFKAMEDYDKITNKNSKQWHLKQFYRLDNEGFYKIGEYYAIAIGQFYSNTIGQTFIIELESRTIKVIIGDVKAVEDTVNKMYCKENKSIIEFIVNTDIMTHEKLQQIMSGKLLKIWEEIQ